MYKPLSYYFLSREYTQTLNKSHDRRLLDIPEITETTKTTNKKREALSWATTKLAFKYMLHRICLRHKGFTLTFQDKERIHGKITKVPVWEAEWLTARLVALFNRSLLTQAIKFGVTDWSIVFQRCLGLTLQSTCTCRSGEASVGRYYEDHECLLYKDVLLKVIIDPKIPSENSHSQPRIFQGEDHLAVNNSLKHNGPSIKSSSLLA